MFVQYDDRPIPPPRMHPWTVVEGDPDARYWNFRANPEKIPEVLEDFRPFADYAAIQRYYEFLSWMNGPSSHFETNDCALGSFSVDHHTPELVRRAFSADPISIHGRLTVIYRELLWNTSRTQIDWLKSSLHDQLRDNVGNYPAVIFVGEWPHFFSEIEKEGVAVTLQYWAWGDNEDMAMENLGSTFDTLHQLFAALSANIETWLRSNRLQ